MRGDEALLSEKTWCAWRSPLGEVEVGWQSGDLMGADESHVLLPCQMLARAVVPSAPVTLVQDVCVMCCHNVVAIQNWRTVVEIYFEFVSKMN